MAHVFYESVVECPAGQVAEQLQARLAPPSPDEPGIWYELDVPFEDLHLPRLGRFSRTVLLRLGEPEQRSHATVMPISWHVPDSRAFPEFHGWIETVPVSDLRTQLAVLGDYTPPLGLVGSVIDAIGGHVVAEITVRRFVEELRHILEGSNGPKRIPSAHS